MDPKKCTFLQFHPDFSIIGWYSFRIEKQTSQIKLDGYGWLDLGYDQPRLP